MTDGAPRSRLAPPLSTASLAMLTWRAPKTLAHTLERLNPILCLFKDRVIVCQESDPQEIAIAENHGFRVVALKANVGIQHGMQHAVEACNNDQVLFLENDVVLEESEATSCWILTRLNALLEAGEINFAKLRRLPLAPRDKVTQYWRVTDGRPARRLYGTLRWNRANQIASELVCANLVPGFRSPYLTDHGNGLYLTDSKYCRWENLAVFMNRPFFLDRLIPFAIANPTSRGVNGQPDLEHRVNSASNRYWWAKQRFSAAIVKPGLFGHRRLDRLASDDKWHSVNPSDDGGPVEIYNPDTERDWAPNSD